MEITLKYQSIEGMNIRVTYQATTVDELGKLLFTLPMIATEDAEFGEEEEPKKGRPWN
jgi:hypothetical protein